MEPKEKARRSHGKTRKEPLAGMTLQRDEAAAHARGVDAILNAVADPMVVYDLQMRIVRSNAAFQEILTRCSPNPTGATIKDRADGIGIFDIQGNALAEAQMPQNRMLQGETITSADPALIVTRYASGAEDIFSVTGGPMYEEGKIAGAVVFFRDITERRQARADLQRANERFRLAERATNGFVYEWTPRDGIHFRSEGFERLLGYRPEELPPTWTAWAQIVYPGDWQVTTDAEEVAYLETLPGDTLENEYRVRHRDGHYLTVAEHSLIERDPAGHVVRLIGQIHDITERKRSEVALRQSEERLRLLIESAEDYSIFTVDVDGVINSWNEGARRMFGWSAQEIIGQHGEALFTPEDRAAGVPAQELATALHNGRALDERFHLRKDGSRLYVSGTVSTIHDGELRGFVKIARDLTERKHAEEALQQAHDELEQRVAERTRELDSANKELRRLSQRVLEAQESERRLIARELHDEIGQQLTGVKMLLETLEESVQEHDATPSALKSGASADSSADPSLYAPHLSEISDAVAYTLERVRDLSLDLRPAVLDSLGLLPALQWQFERFTHQTGVQVDFSADGLDHRLPARLEAGIYRLIQEALTNVARYAGVAEATVQIYVTEETVSVYIVDRGAGFDVEQALAAGSSTGLAGMRERADLLGGTVSIDSAPGDGTTIHAQLSITQAIEMDAMAETEEETEYGDWRTPQSDAIPSETCCGI